MLIPNFIVPGLKTVLKTRFWSKIGFGYLFFRLSTSQVDTGNAPGAHMRTRIRMQGTNPPGSLHSPEREAHYTHHRRK